MSISKAVGIETEYGIVTQTISPAQAGTASARDPIAASRAVVGQIKNAGIIAAPQRTMAGFVDFRPEQRSLRVIAATTPADRHESEENGWMLANGARIYVDHAHPEYCTPECLSPRDLVAADKAGEILLERCRQSANAVWEPLGRRILLYKNNSDHKGNSYGCHENYLLGAGFYEDLLARRPSLVASLVTPFFISRTILCGAGKVGSENETAPAGFQLSQRADFFETLTGLQTTHRRPLFNTRDEAHAEAARFRRLHVIIGDANLAEFSTFLKVGTAQIFFRMLEDGFLQCDFAFADPLAAMRAVSRDLTFREPLALASGGRTTALEIQRELLRLARQYAETAELSEDARDVLNEWDDALACLETDWRPLATRLDWAVKRNLLEKYLDANKRTWEQVTEWQPVIEAILQAEAAQPAAAGSDESPAGAVLRQAGLSEAEYTLQRQLYFGLRRLDLEYHDIRRGPSESEAGLFYRLQNRGAIERLLSDEEIERLVEHPPDGTRARLRGQYLTQFGDSVIWADWSCLQIAGPAYGYRHGVILRLNDPLDAGEETEKEATG